MVYKSLVKRYNQFYLFIFSWMSNCNCIQSIWKSSGTIFMLTESGVANTQKNDVFQKSCHLAYFSLFTGLCLANLSEYIFILPMPQLLKNYLHVDCADHNCCGHFSELRCKIKWKQNRLGKKTFVLFFIFYFFSYGELTAKQFLFMFWVLSHTVFANRTTEHRI